MKVTFKELLSFLKANPGFAVLLTLPLITGVFFGQSLVLIALLYLGFFSLWIFSINKLNSPKP